MTPNLYFLLGGRDLEMKTISELLMDKGIPFSDHSLQWHNAFLGSYTKELERYGDQPSWVIYGIELQEDVLPPFNYVCIDHHTQHAGKPTSLEQVATLLHHQLTRHQRLIAANDVSYIPGMYQAGATDEEVMQIRYEDRRMQGVTSEEESLALRSIQENKTQCGDMIIVCSCTSRFSPICDRLYPYKKLLIYTDEELTYYGDGVTSLIELFQPYIQKKQVYYGGGEQGFLGTARGAFTKQTILQLVNQIKAILS